MTIESEAPSVLVNITDKAAEKAKALMEAAHQGLPIVSTHAAAIGEFIEDGESGLLVPPGSPADLGNALARMAEAFLG